MTDDVIVDTTVAVVPKRKDGHISAGLSADQTLFERVQSTKLLLAFFIFSVSAVFCWVGKIDAKALVQVLLMHSKVNSPTISTTIMIVMVSN
jgi:hypothetical protein